MIKMRPKKSGFILLVLLGAMGFTLPVWAQDMIDVSDANRIALGIQTETLQSATKIEFTKATGRVVAPIGQSQFISSPFDGVLMKPLVVAGMEVKKGQNIALIQSADYAAIQTERAQAKLMAEHTEELAKRAVDLGDLGLRSVAEVDEAKHEAQASLISLRAIETRLNRVRSVGRSGQFYLTATDNGIITHVHAASGTPVSIADPITTLFSGKTYWARVPVPSANINSVDIGTAISLQNTDLTGSVIAIDPEVDGVSQTVDVTIELPAELSWRLGGLVTATFLAPPPSGAVAVPSRAIVRMSGQTYVFHEVDGGFQTVPVKVLSQSYQTSFVSGNLSETDTIAVSGLAALKNVAEGG